MDLLTWLTWLTGSAGADMPMVWTFPYFLEPRILECLPSLTMLDYQVRTPGEACRPDILLAGCYGFLQVDYDNHPLYKRGETARKRSPVRIFTNIPARDFVLPEEEGYR